MSINSSIEFLKGIGTKRADLLKSEAGIETIEDLLYYSPRKYIDRSNLAKISDCSVNDEVTVIGEIIAKRILGGTKKFLEVEITDGVDRLSGIFFGGIEYFSKTFTIGNSVSFSGKISYNRKRQIVHPDFDVLDETNILSAINTGRVIPLYPSSEKLKSSGFTSRFFRKIIFNALQSYLTDIIDPIPEDIILKNGLIKLPDAIKMLHFPEKIEETREARTRLAYNELFFMQVYFSVSRALLSEKFPGDINEIDASIVADFVKRLPFNPTSDQLKAIDEIKTDMEKPRPMNRLLHGDVGSGKTVVAACSSFIAKFLEKQTAIMAPTEILSKQHYDTFMKIIPPSLRVEILTGSMKQKIKKKIYSEIENGDIDIVIGTHALIQEGVNFKNLGLVIIDEQHRFGLNQRASLREKGTSPHLLVMSATPIPRSLALTLYGDMDVSFIKEKPKNRLEIKTFAFQESKLKSVYNSVEKYVSQGRQCYFILPLVEESEKIDLKSAVEVYENLKNNIFPQRRVALLHGKMDPDVKDNTMKEFSEGKFDILVSTTVIEVGIDVPNSNIIVIMHAERFGLSQLHQLRGRVGRGAHQSFCVLVHPDNISKTASERIKIMTETNDGFVISEKDLSLRGAGDITGTRQSGYRTDFEFADIVSDLDLMIKAKEDAGDFVKKNLMLSKHGSLAEIFKKNDYFRNFRTKKLLSILS